MVKILALLLSVLVACKPAPRELRALAGLAPDDATAPDAAPPGPWPRHTITQGASTGVFRGADGVDLRAGCVATAWEEGGIVTSACRGSDVRAPWTTTVIATGAPGVEDAKYAGDLDGDGLDDIVSCSDAGQRCYISFGGGPTVDVAASHGHNRIMQASIADVDGDGDRDIVFGSRVGTAANPAVIGVLYNPGGTSARGAAGWTYGQLSIAGWAMTVLAADLDHDGDIDVLVTDRSYYLTVATGTTRQWDLNGPRWLEQTPTGWINHPIGAHPPGDEMMASLADVDGDGALDVVDCQSAAGHPNHIAIHTGAGWATTTQVADVPGVGHCQHPAVGDIDGDGLPDIAVSTWETNALPTSPLIGAYWMRNTGSGFVLGGDISGPDGSKHDNLILYDVDGDGDLDAIDSEQVDNEGVFWWENQLRPGMP